MNVFLKGRGDGQTEKEQMKEHKLMENYGLK